MTDTTITWGEVQGRTITFPMEVEELRAATVLYSVPADGRRRAAAGRRLRGRGGGAGHRPARDRRVRLRPQPVGRLRRAQPRLPGPTGGRPARGDRLVRVPDAGEPGLHLRGRQPGDGLPEDGRRPHRHLHRRDGLVPTGDGRPPRPHAHRAPCRAARRARAGGGHELLRTSTACPTAPTCRWTWAPGIVDPADVQLELGDSPVADELRSLGLPTTPDFATWGEGLSATFLLGRPV